MLVGAAAVGLGGAVVAAALLVVTSPPAGLVSAGALVTLPAGGLASSTVSAAGLPPSMAWELYIGC